MAWENKTDSLQENIEDRMPKMTAWGVTVIDSIQN